MSFLSKLHNSIYAIRRFHTKINIPKIEINIPKIDNNSQQIGINYKIEIEINNPKENMNNNTNEDINTDDNNIMEGIVHNYLKYNPYSK